LCSSLVKKKVVKENLADGVINDTEKKLICLANEFQTFYDKKA